MLKNISEAQEVLKTENVTTAGKPGSGVTTPQGLGNSCLAKAPRRLGNITLF